MPPTTIEITIQRRTGSEAPVVAVLRAPGNLPVQRTGVLRLDDDALLHLQTLLLEPLAYGTFLGQALFQGDVRDLFVQSRAAAEAHRRVLLVVEDPQLKPLYWQRLCAPRRSGGAGWDFLALDQQEPFSLYLPSQTDRRYPPFGRRDLRALVVVAAPPADNPYHLDTFDAPATVASLVAALGDIPCDVLAEVAEAAGPPTLDALVTRCTSQPYTLLHIVAHGQYSLRSGETMLYLLDDHGAVDPIPAEQLLQRLDRVQGVRGLPHLAFLATCQSADPRAEAAGALGGLAQRLVRDLGMPAVVAMTERVSIPTAAALAHTFYAQLRIHGEVDRALAEASAGLAERGDITVPALYSRLGGLPLFSDSLDRALTPAEVTYGVERLRGLLPVRAPVLLPSFETLAARWEQVASGAADLAATRGQTERAGVVQDLNQLTADVLETVSFDALALGREPPPYDARCPFRGLQAFHAEDRDFFFGRETWVARLCARLVEHNFLAVLGPSGSGKSSLVLAGLLPAWRERTPGLHVAVMTPGREPLDQLEAVLAGYAGTARLLIVDQFEELFTLVTDDDRRRRFVERLLETVRQQPVVLTMRAEFWGDCASYPALRDAMQAHQELLPPMTANELRSAMEQQAGAAGLRFEADLSQTLLDDVADEPGAMPLLQHALLELWKRRHGRWLRVAEYRALGGVSQAIARTAESVYAALAPDERPQVRSIFLRLVRLDEREAQRDTRRRVTLDELVTQGTDRATVVRLVTRLADEKLLVTQVDPLSGADEVELAHEALIDHWQRLREWIHQDRQTIAQLQSINHAASAWNQRQRPDGMLLQDPLLREALTFQAAEPAVLNRVEREFLAASQRHKRAGRIKIGLLVAPLLLVPLLLLLAALLQLDFGLQKETGWQRVATWEQATAGVGQYGAFVALDTADARWMYGADRSQGGIYRTSDGGQSWEKVASQVFDDKVVRSLAVGHDGTVVAATSGCAFELSSPRAAQTNDPVPAGNCLYVSQDRGTRWQPIPLPVTEVKPGARLAAAAIDPNDAQALTIGLWHDGVWRTIDGGGTWQRVSSVEALENSHLIRALAVRNDALFIATDEGLFRTPVEGTTDAVPERIGPPGNVVVSALAIEPDTGDLFVGTRGNGTWRVRGTQWVSESSYGDDTAHTYSMGPGRDVLYVGTSNHGLLRRQIQHWWQGQWWASTKITPTAPASFAPTPPPGMVWVPAGEFEMGAPERARLVYVEGFYITADEISQEIYCASNTCAGADPARADYPQVSITGRQAAEACEKLGYRLATEAEWEKAARGPDGRTYPWGDREPTPREANLYYGDINITPDGAVQMASPADAWPVHDYEDEKARGVSPYGVFHMSGNVSEITTTEISSKQFLVLGAGYTTLPRWSSAYYREKGSEIRSDSSGLRCVRDQNR